MSVEDLDPADRDRHLRWLLDACRYWLTGDDPPREPDDWEGLGRFAYFHDLDPLLHHLATSARPSFANGLPDRLGRQWEGAYYRNFVFNLELLDTLERFLDAAREAGVTLRVFKGPVTIARGWTDPALRIMADVDLFCRQSDLPRLGEIARALDFEPGRQTAVHHLALAHPELPASLELHHRLYEVFARPDELFERLWAERDTVEVDGRNLPAPSPEMAVVLDVGHLLQHDLQLNLKPLLDLSATLWRQRRTLDLERLRELLVTADLEPEFRTLLGLVTHTLGLPAGTPDPVPAPPVELSRALLDRLRSPERLDRVGALAGPHRRGGARSTAGYAMRRILPPLDLVRAMTGGRSRARALLAYPAHAASTLGRALRRWRSSGPGASGASLKAGLFRRRQGPQS